jgi:hypothetical protein
MVAYFSKLLLLPALADRQQSMQLQPMQLAVADNGAIRINDGYRAGAAPYNMRLMVEVYGNTTNFTGLALVHTL